MFEQREKEALVALLASELDQNGSWCGETHIQKATYLLEEVLNVPLGYKHVLYKYGPYSEALTNDLNAMLADGLLWSKAVESYGPRLLPTDAAKDQLWKRWQSTLSDNRKKIDFVAKKVGNKGVSDLEKLTTAVWVTKRYPKASRETHIEELREIKPHISTDAALKALNELKSLQSEADKVLAISE